MNGIMLDLETLSSEPDAAIVAIGAVKFDEQNGLGETFYSVIHPESAEKYGHISGSTFAWWCQQSQEARRIFSPGDKHQLPDALSGFTNWVQGFCKDGKIPVWGNGSDFDNVILQHAYKYCQLEKPWRFNFNRCYRTVKDMVHGDVQNALWTKHSAGLTHHNALDDAKRQALILLDIWQLLKK